MTEQTKKLSLKPKDPSAKLEERLHKVLAQAGLGSRRALEQRIADGLLKVNGETAQTGMSVQSGDKIELDGRQFVCSQLIEPTRLLMYNKPEGEVTTREDPEGRPTIFENLPSLKGARWIAIGRLDINTTGLLLLTTDGELANALMHPSYEVEREYVCRVRAPEGMDHVGENIVDRLRRGVSLDDGPAKFDRVERIGEAETESHDWFQVTVSEGRNREVRRLWESQGCQVSRLKRVRYGKLTLPRELRRGHCTEVAPEIVKDLRESLGLADSLPSALTLQPVIGQRRATKSVIRLDPSESRRQGNAEEANELRRFDSFRDDRRGGRSGKRGGPGGGAGGLTVSGEAAARQSDRPFKQRREKGPNLPDGSPAAFRSWYVPEGVDTGARPSRGGPGGGNAGRGGPRGDAGRGAPRGDAGRGGPGAGARRGPGAGAGGPRSRTGGPGGQGVKGGPGGGRRAGGFNPRAEGGQGESRGPTRDRMPYGHPGNAPTFPSDYANGGNYSGYGDRPASPRGPARAGNRGPGGPGGNRGPGGPGGPRKPGGNRGPGGNKGGPRGPRGNGGGNSGGGSSPWGNR